VSTRPKLSGKRLSHLLVTLLVSSGLTLTVPGCATLDNAVPRCGDLARLALVAQSVPTASYVPCVVSLPAGLSARVVAVKNGETKYSLLSDRAQGHAVGIRLTSRCRTGKVVSAAPRARGVRTYLDLKSIDPRYAGTLYDKFSGGCVSYAFDFERGPHIALVQEFETAVRLVPRHELALQLQSKLGLELGP
jgi:hypothetical protein